MDPVRSGDGTVKMMNKKECNLTISGSFENVS
jgi:hypothetical protein